MSLLVTLSRGIAQFSVLRFLLGLSESVNYPAGVKVCAEWFPAKERATAVGIFQSGSAIGAMITPAIAAWLIVQFGWRAAFVLVALPGFLWVPFWLRSYAPLERHSRVSDAERRYIISGRGDGRAGDAQQIRWSFFLKQRQVLAIAAARFLEEPSGWFYFTWLPLYLSNYRDTPLTRVGVLLIIPFLALDIGKVGGGWVSSRLMKQGWTLDRARKIVMLVSAFCMLGSIPAMWADTPLASVLFISLATFGHGCWATTTQTIPGDIVPARFVGTVYGITRDHSVRWWRRRHHLHIRHWTTRRRVRVVHHSLCHRRGSATHWLRGFRGHCRPDQAGAVRRGCQPMTNPSRT
jgi:MFS transporter, ACS family, hexuronate transporter